jgi:hypothetical protein
MALTIVFCPRVNLCLLTIQKALTTGFLYSYLTAELQTSLFAAKPASAGAESPLGRRLLYTTTSLTTASSRKHPLVGDDTVIVADDPRSFDVESSVIFFVEVVSHEKVKASVLDLRQLGNVGPLSSGENDIHRADPVKVAPDMTTHGLVVRGPLFQ